MQTYLKEASAQSIAEAAELLRSEEVVGVPTETVYGLAGSALSETAVHKIFAAKGRPQDNPLISHISDMEMLPMVATQIPASAYKLAAAFWPGPLTMVLPRSTQLANAVCAGLDTAAVRMPSHPVALALIRACGLPLAAPSANLSGSPSPTTAQDVYSDLQGKIPLILDGGVCEVGVESTVVSLTGDTPMLLRPGVITVQQLEAALEMPVAVSHTVTEQLNPGEQAASPGMKYKHYAPKARVILVKGSAKTYCAYVRARVSEAENADEGQEKGVCAMCFAEDEASLPCTSVPYGAQTDATAQARYVFSALRKLDALGAHTVYVHCPRTDGVALAVYNRLLRAAAFCVVDADKPCRVVAITGRSGSGKSTVSAHYAALGYPVLDGDKIAREITRPGSPCLAALVQAFGADIVDETGALLRGTLAARAFSNSENTKKLTDITHPAIRTQLLKEIETARQAGAGLVFVDGAVIVGTPFEAHCDVKIVVVTSEKDALSRIVLRDGISKQAARNRLAVQTSAEALVRAADYVLHNDDARQTLLSQADAVLRQLVEQA